MNKISIIKNIFLGLILIGVVLFFVFMFWDSQKNKTPEANKPPSPIIKSFSLEGLEIKIPENESYTVNLNKKTLSDGKNIYIAEFNQKIPGESYPLRGSVVLIDNVKFENDKYLIMPMAANFGGSGEFIYLVLLEKTDNGLKHLESLAVGDRIKSVSFEQKDSKITFNYMSHHDTQAMVEEPFVPTHLEFQVINGKFIEDIKYFNTTADDIIVKMPKVNSDVSSIFDISFDAQSWLFENTSLVKVISPDYQEIASSTAASVDGDWAKPGIVSIKSQLNVASYKGKAKVILMADNPSGMPEKDKKVEFWVNIK